MADFLYVAKDRRGRQVSGEIEAHDAKTAQKKLQDQELAILRLDPVPPKPWIFKVLHPVRPELVVLYTRQMATMLATGISMARTLEAVAPGEGPPRFRKALHNVALDVHSGYSVSQAMKRAPEYFSPFLVGSVRIGEVSARLPETLDNCARHLEKEHEYGLRLKLALVYPTVLLLCCSLLVAFCFTFMVPKFLMLFGDMKLDLPTPTRLLLEASRLVERYGPVAAATLAGPACLLTWLLARWSRTRQGQWHLDWLLLRLPWYGLQVKRRILAQYFRSLSTLLRSGVPVTSSLYVLSESLDREVARAAARYQLTAVRDGIPLSDGMRRTGFFPPLALELMRVGEEVGDPTPMLDRLAEFFDEEMTRGLDTLSRLIEPIVLLVMGGAVAFLLLAAFLPIYRLAQSF